MITDFLLLTLKSSINKKEEWNEKKSFFVLIVFFLYIILSMQIIQNKPKKKNSLFYPIQIPQSPGFPTLIKKLIKIILLGRKK